MRSDRIWVLAVLLSVAPGLIYAVAFPHPTDPVALQATGMPPALAEWQLSNKYMSEESKSPAYTIQVTKPVLNADNDDAFNHQVDDYLNTTVNGFKEGAKNAPTDTGTGSALTITYDLLSSGGGVLSLRFVVSSYSAGAAHPITFVHTLTYDLNSGTVLTLAGLFKPDAKYLDVIAKYCADDLQRRGLLNFPDGAAPKPENYQNWNFERGGLMITFDQGQVGPEAQGTTDVWIPYQVLADVLQTTPPLTWWRF